MFAVQMAGHFFFLAAPVNKTAGVIDGRSRESEKEEEPPAGVKSFIRKYFYHLGFDLIINENHTIFWGVLN